MSRSLLTEAFPRFSIGTAAGLLSGLVVFRASVFQPTHLAFECLSVGALTAGVLTLVRLSLRGQGLALALAWGVLRLGLEPWAGWPAALAGLPLGVGVFLVALVFDELARCGLRLGKFLAAGPLLGGVYLAVAPLSEFHELLPFDVVRPLLVRAFLGIVIGNGVGVGIEVAELFLVRPTGDAPPQALEWKTGSGRTPLDAS